MLIFGISGDFVFMEINSGGLYFLTSGRVGGFIRGSIGVILWATVSKWIVAWEEHTSAAALHFSDHHSHSMARKEYSKTWRGGTYHSIGSWKNRRQKYSQSDHRSSEKRKSKI
ncbi:hypothetical protein AtEden1_Chr4g0291871 [Arabidopsis thaliana]